MIFAHASFGRGQPAPQQSAFGKAGRRFTLVAGWSAFWLVTLLQACCALWVIPACAMPAHGVEQIYASGGTSSSQHGQSSPCERPCPELLSPDASLQRATVPAAPAPAASDLPALPAQPVLVLARASATSVAHAGYQSPPPRSSLYLRTSRLLI